MVIFWKHGVEANSLSEKQFRKRTLNAVRSPMLGGGLLFRPLVLQWGNDEAENMETANQIEILLVEDNPLDAEMTIRTFKKHNFLNPLQWVKDGQQALDFLFCEAAYINRKGMAPPKLILLDIKMPKVNGIEVLQKIKEDSKLRLIPVVIMTSSSEQPDIEEAYRLGVNSYVVKPVEFGAFAETIAKIGMYWIMTNRGIFDGK